MPAGLKYDLNPIEKTMPELCRFDTVYRLSGGFNLDTTNLSGFDRIPPMTPLSVDFKARTAKVVVNVEVAEKISASSTTLKIKKGSFAYVGMHLGNGSNGGTIEAIDKTSSTDYDTVTLAASPTLAADAGAVLFEASAATGKAPKVTANALNYSWKKVEAGVSVAAIGRAYEIRTSKLLVPISENDKTSLGDRFMFTY